MTQKAKTRPQPKAVAVASEAEGFFWHWSNDQIEPADSPSEGLWNGFFFEEVECENPF